MMINLTKLLYDHQFGNERVGVDLEASKIITVISLFELVVAQISREEKCLPLIGANCI